MADFIVFRKSGEAEDGTPSRAGPGGRIVRDLKADEVEAAVARIPGVAVGDTLVVFRWDTSVELDAEGPPQLIRTRG